MSFLSAPKQLSPKLVDRSGSPARRYGSDAPAVALCRRAGPAGQLQPDSTVNSLGLTTEFLRFFASCRKNSATRNAAASRPW